MELDLVYHIKTKINIQLLEVAHESGFKTFQQPLWTGCEERGVQGQWPRKKHRYLERKPEGVRWGSAGKEPACSAGDPGSIPGLGRSPGEGIGYPLQYSCLENPMDRGAWWAIVHGVAKSRTRLSDSTLTGDRRGPAELQSRVPPLRGPRPQPKVLLLQLKVLNGAMKTAVLQLRPRAAKHLSLFLIDLEMTLKPTLTELE